MIKELVHLCWPYWLAAGGIVCHGCRGARIEKRFYVHAPQACHTREPERDKKAGSFKTDGGSK